MTQFRDDFNLEELLRQAFLPDDGPLRMTLPNSVIESWGFAANELGLPIEEAKLHPRFLSTAR